MYRIGDACLIGFICLISDRCLIGVIYLIEDACLIGVICLIGYSCLIIEPAINNVLVLILFANNGGSYRLQEPLLL